MKKLKMDSEVMVYTIIGIVLGLFIYFLPRIDQALRDFWHSF